MAVLSPGIVVALITLFFINRVSQRLLAFEQAFFVGLKYCLEPSPSDLAAVSASLNAAAAAGESVASSPKKQAKPGKKKTKPSSADNSSHGLLKAGKPGPASLPIVRNRVSPTMFVGEPDLPKNREFGYLLGMTSSFVVSHVFEDVAMCVAPGLASKFHVSQTHWFGALIFIVGVFELIDMSRTMSSTTVVGLLTAVGTVIALALVANGDSAAFFMLDTAFETITAWCEYTHVEKLSLSVESAPRYARALTTAARVSVALLAGLLFASSAVPARRFAGLDYELYLRYRRDEEDEREDPYALPKPTQLLVLAFALDYILPVLALASFFRGRSSDGVDPFPAVRIGYLLGAVALRLALSRVRMQTYLDSAVDHFRSFWIERRGGHGNVGDVEAGNRLRVRVVSTYYYLPTLGSLYAFNPVVALVLAVLSKRSGGMTFGICRVADTVQGVSLGVSAREIFGFLAWVALASYSLFSILSFTLDAFLDFVDPPQLDGAGGGAMSSSQRRRLRRKRKVA